MVNLATGYLKTSLTSRFQQRTMAAARKVNSAQWKVGNCPGCDGLPFFIISVILSRTMLYLLLSTVLCFVFSMLVCFWLALQLDLHSALLFSVNFCFDFVLFSNFYVLLNVAFINSAMFQKFICQRNCLYFLCSLYFWTKKISLISQ